MYQFMLKGKNTILTSWFMNNFTEKKLFFSTEVLNQ